MEWQVGKFKIQLAIRDWFRLDGGILWSGIPRDKWVYWTGYTFEMDGHGNVRNPVNCFFITTPHGERILVDTSFGRIDRWRPETAKRFGMENDFNDFENGVLRGPHFVVPSHAHFDHAGGCVKYESGSLVPAYPNAMYLFHKAELAHALSAHPKTRSSYLRETIEGLQVLRDKGYVSRIIRNKITIREGLTFIRTQGHTPGHISVKIESEGQVAFIPGALLPTRYHGIIACGVGNDTHGLQAADHKMSFLKRAAKGNWLLLLEHDPGVAFRASSDKDGNYRLVSVS